jgi:FixJ family two-component response regulator
MREMVVAIVEDDPGALKATERLVRAHGFRAEGFASAEAFLARESGQEPACLVLDIHLKGMSGMELRRYLNANGSRLPVIFITAADDHATRREAMQAGCVAYLQKPFSSRLLIDAINKAIGRSI